MEDKEALVARRQIDLGVARLAFQYLNAQAVSPASHCEIAKLPSTALE